MATNKLREAAISNSAAVFRGQYYRITILSERLIRFEYDLEGKFMDEPTEFAINRNFSVPEMKVQQDDKYLEIVTKYFAMLYVKEKPFIGPKYAPDSNLKVILKNTDKIWYFNHPEARNFKGSAVSLDDDSTKAKLHKGLYSTDGFASIDDSHNLVIDKEGFLVHPKNKRIDTYLFIYRRDFGLCLKDYFELTGKPYLIPRYALGIWWNRDKIYSFEDTKNLVKAFNRYGIPLSILLLGEFWHIKDAKDYNKFKTGYTFNKNLFPSPTLFTSYMHEHGVRVGLNIDPCEGIFTHEDKYSEVSGLIGLQKEQTIPFAMFDKLFVEIYMDRLIKSLSNFGVDFYWIDYKGRDFDSLKALNYYHMKENEGNSEKRSMVLSRNSLVAAHRYPVHYSGETTVSWKTLNYLPEFNASASNIGLSWWSHDVGGFKDGIEESELYIRNVQFATFSPIFRFSAKRGIYYKRAPWLWDVKTFNIVREYCNLRHRLIPYLYSEGYKYSNNGLPLVQPLYYYYPEMYDEPTYKNEYYFGTELFVAPITKPNETVMNRAIERIFLPKGMWYDFKTGKKFPGNKRYVVFYKDEDYPVFAKSGSIVPMAILDKNLNDTSLPKKMEIHVFPGKSNVYKLYEDDGVTSLNEEGYYTITSIDYNYLANNYTLIIRPIEGKNGIVPASRDYKIRFRNTRVADDVIVYLDNELIDLNNVQSYEEDTDFIVEVKNVDTTRQLTINCKGQDIEIDAVRIINEDIASIISDLKIETFLKEKIHAIIFSELSISKKRILIKKLKKDGLQPQFIRMFLRLLEYISEI